MADENRRIRLRYDTATNFASANPTLAAGEVSITSDTGVWKVGNGVDAYNDLSAVIDGDSTVSLTGNQSIAGTKTFTGRVKLAEDVKIELGDAFEAYNDGASTYLVDKGTGPLILQTNGPGIRIQGSDGETLAWFSRNGQVELWFDGVKRAETTTDGLTVTGEIRAGTVAGDIIATEDQMNAGLLNNRVITPKRLRDTHPRPLWLGPFNAGTGTLFTADGIPAWANQIEVMLSGISFAGSDNLLVRLGTTAGIRVDGYVSERKDETATSSTGLIVGVANFLMTGRMTLFRAADGGNLWYSDHSAIGSVFNYQRGSGYIQLNNALTRLQFVGSAGGAFAAGSVSLLCRQ